MKNKKTQNTEAPSTTAKTKFSALDVVIILLVIVSVVGIYFRFNLIETITQSANAKQYVVSFSIENIRYTTPNYVNVDDELYITSSNEYLGKVISASDEMSNSALSVTPASEVFVENGEFIEVYYPNAESRVDANGRFVCVGTYTDDRGLIINNSTHITAGQEISVKTEFVTLIISITNIETID